MGWLVILMSRILTLRLVCLAIGLILGVVLGVTYF